jgi:hypothetical protein
VAGLKKTIEAIPAGGTRRVYGIAYYDGTRWYANVNGNNLEARWLDPIRCVQGESIVVDITDQGNGQSSALVIGGYTDQPRPSTGSVTEVIPAGIATQIAFTGADGIAYITDRFIGEYSLGDPIYLSWDSSFPTIIGKIPAIPEPQPTDPPPPPPAPKPVEGTLKAAATKTDTYSSVGGWNSFGGSTFGGEQLYSGFMGTEELTGAWFYGAAFTVLAGRTIIETRFRLPARLNIGAEGTATVHLYAHTSSTLPGSDVVRTDGPFNVPVAQAEGAHWVTLPPEFAPVLLAGGGISIAGDPFVGFDGRIQDPESGRIEMDWTA